MVQTVLVPVDGSELANRVLAPLGKLLEGDAKVILLRVVEQGPGATQGLAEQGKQELAALRERLQAEGVTVDSLLRQGDAAGEILEVAEELRPTLIAMSTHGHSGVTRLVRGSVAERVLRHTTTPLLLCTPAALDHERVDAGFPAILVPLDGSERSAKILPHVEALAKAYGSRVTLLRVEPFVPSAVPSPLLTPQTWDPDSVAATLEPHRARLEQAGVQAEVKATMGIEAAEILDAAEDADLVAMTTHGRTGLSRWWFGSVAEQVLRHCTRPLLVARVPEE